MKTLPALLLAATCGVVIGCATTLTKQDAVEKQRRDTVVRKANQIKEGCIRAGYAWDTDEHRDCMFPQLLQLMDTYYPVPDETDFQKMARLADLLNSMPPETSSQQITRALVEACNRSFKLGSMEALDCVMTRMKLMFPKPRERRSATCTPAYGGGVTCTED